MSDELRVNAQSSDEHSREAIANLVSLKANERAILYLRIVEGQKFADIAQTLGIREAAARQRASRAMTRLRSHYRID
ncbi:MAG: sigma factor-like helix-turn-helix DNA-binding protein [Acidimicrobiales bacterium]